VPTDRPRAEARPGDAARSSWLRLRDPIDRTSDAGFTMVEMIVALVIIGIIMTALGSFFVTTVSATARQGSSQSAVQLADDGIEQVRALKGASAVNGRDYTSSKTQWDAPVTGVASYESDMGMAFDTNAATGAGATATLPTTGKSTVINGLTYTQNWYVGSCWQPIGGGACTNLATPPVPVNNPTSPYASFYRVVVAVTWSDSVCKYSACVFIAATLVSNGQFEPLFNSGQSAQAPTPVNPGDQTSDVGVPITPVQLTSTGGAGTIIWSGSGFPTGSGSTAMSITSSGLISGTPTAVGTYSVTVTAKDSFQLVGTAIFKWTVVAAPSVSAANQTSTRNAAIAAYTPTASGGSGTLTWSDTGLPDGLSFDSSTGTITGTPSAASVTSTSVVIKVTDSQGQSASKTITWTIQAAPTLTITTPAPQTSPVNTAISALSVAKSGGVGPYTWTAANLPTGLSISSSGSITGTPTALGSYSVTVTVADSSTQTATTSSFTWNIWGILTPSTTLGSDTNTLTSIPLAAGFGSGNYTWSTTNGTGTNNTLPTGLSLSTTSGVTNITGTTQNTSSNKTYNFNLVATDTGTGQTSSINITWDVTNNPIVTGPYANQYSALNVSISFSASSANFSSTPNWTASGLPAGITMDSTGAFSGKPTVAGTYSVTITAKKGSNTDSQTFTWTVAPAVSASAPTGPITSVRNKAITPISATASGGTGTLVWTASNLPAGLSISSAGVITGTTVNAGSTNSTVLTVADQYGLTAKLSFTWTVS
jgi:prepilin-type N-terminal cleavage/methylation domain-containing protein